MSLSNHAGEAISMEALWNRLFGDWRRFEAPSTLVTLARQASETWIKLAAKLAAPLEAEGLREQVNALHRAVAEPFVYDLRPRFIAFVQANPDLENDAITSLHSALDGIETACRLMREPLIEIGEARAAAKQKASAPVEVELDRSAPWKSLPAVEAGQAANMRPSTLDVKDYLPGLLHGRAA